MKYDLRAEDWPLIEAAIRLGDWLVSQPEVTEEQQKAIRCLQSALRRLPEASPGVDVEYGFSAVIGEGYYVEMKEDEWEGLYRSWGVSMFPPGLLEIFSIYTPHPEVDYFEQMAHELEFALKAGEPNERVGDFYYQEWIAEVSDPGQFRKEGVHFEIEAEFGPHAELFS